MVMNGLMDKLEDCDNANGHNPFFISFLCNGFHKLISTYNTREDNKE